jgi:hypothetical protein
VLDWAYEKWLDGYSQTDIACALGIGPVRLSNLLSMSGYTKVKPPLHPPKEFFDDNKIKRDGDADD